MPVYIKHAEAHPVGGEPPPPQHVAYESDSPPLRTFAFDEPIPSSTEVPNSPVSFFSEAALMEAERQRALAEEAKMERLESQRRIRSEARFGDRLSALGETLVNFVEEKRHEVKAEQIERDEMARKLHEVQAARKSRRPQNQPPHVTHHQDLRSSK